MRNKPRSVSIPPCDRATDAPTTFPVRLRVRVTPRATCLGVEELYGVTQRRKGSIACSDWRTELGTETGRDERAGRSREGVEV